MGNIEGFEIIAQNTFKLIKNNKQRCEVVEHINLLPYTKLRRKINNGKKKGFH